MHRHAEPRSRELARLRLLGRVDAKLAMESLARCCRLERLVGLEPLQGIGQPTAVPSTSLTFSLPETLNIFSWIVATTRCLRVRLAARAIVVLLQRQSWDGPQPGVVWFSGILGRGIA